MEWKSWQLHKVFKREIKRSHILKPSFFLWRRAPQQNLRTHRSLKAYCVTLWWGEKWSVFLFLQVMEHQWNENDRGKPKNSGEKAVPVLLCPPQIPHWLTPGSNPGLRGGRPATILKLSLLSVIVDCNPSKMNWHITNKIDNVRVT
jgi:hypothetical protein